MLAADGITANWSLTLPPDEGATGALLLSTVAGTNAATDWLDPGNEGESLVITGGVPTWQDQSGLFWALVGNDGTTAFDGTTGNFAGTGDAVDFVLATDSSYSMKIIGDETGNAGSAGRVIIGSLTNTAGVPGAVEAEEVLNVLGGNLRFNSEGDGAITREIIFDGTGGSGNFRIGSDGGDITWQGGGGQRLQMSSFWGMEFRGNTGITAAPAFAGGVATDPAVNIIGTRVGAPLLTTTPPALQTANQQEWRNDAGTPLAVVDADGDFGIGVTAGLTAKLQIQARAASGNAIQLDPYGAAAGATSEMRYRELSANGANYVGFKAPDDIAADNIYTWPNAYPGADDWVLTSTAAGAMSWQDPLALIDAWFLTGNSNAVATSFVGPTTDNIPLNFATAAATPGDMNWFIGTVAAGNQRMTLSNTTLQVGTAANNVGVDVVGTLRNSGNATIAAAASSNVTMLDGTTPGTVTINGTAGTPNVRIGSISGAANATIPAGFDKLVITDANGDLQQVGFQAGVETYAWSLTGNAGTAPATNFLGTTDAVDFTIRTNNTEALRVSATQQVGIGTAAPSQLLEVEDGNVLISTSAAGTAGALQFEEDGANGNNFFSLQAASAMAGDNAYIWPDAYPAVDDYILTSSAAGVMQWQDPLSLIDAWFLVGNPGATAASFLGPTTASIPLNLSTSNATPGDINMYIGPVAAGNLRVALNNTQLSIGTAANNVATVIQGSLANTGDATLASAASSNVTMLNAGTPGTLTVNGTAGTPNVRIGSISGAANATIPAGFDKLVITDANGDLQQVGFQAGVETYAWSLTGNAGTAPATNFLGTTDAVDFTIRTNNTEALRVSATQQVGIGTATPSQLLEVEDGNILISTSAAGTSGELRFEENGANGNDYVAFNAPGALAASNTYTLPNATGAAGEVLTIAAAPAPTATTATLEWAPVVVTPTVETFTATSDNFAIGQAGTTTFLRIGSDGTATSRTCTLADGTTQGHVMVIRCIATGANGIQLEDAANLELSGNFNLREGDTITLIWDGSDWYETARRNN